MGEEEDPQRIKRIAAAAYDYDRDSRWSEYWSNVLIPPRLASRSDVVDHYKRKFYQRHIDPGLVVEPMPVTSSSQSSTKMNTSASPPVPEQASSSNTGSFSGTGATASSSTTSYSIPFERQTIQFSINTLVLVMALFCTIPLVPKHYANKAYRISMMSSAGSSMYFLYTLYGTPKGWNTAAIRTWFQSVIIAKDFVYLVYCLVFSSCSPVFKSALLPLLCRVVEQNAKYLKRNIGNSSLYRFRMEKYKAVAPHILWQIGCEYYKTIGIFKSVEMYLLEQLVYHLVIAELIG